MNTKSCDIFATTITHWPCPFTLGQTIIDANGTAIARVTRTGMCPSEEELLLRIQNDDGFEKI